MLDRVSAPGVESYINADRAVISTDPALHTARRVRYYLSRGENLMFAEVPLKESEECHMSSSR